MLKVEQAYRLGGLRGIVVFEGWDAGGKGGAIQRLTARLDPRSLQVHEIAKPTAEEQGKHYLWRFWQRLPPPGAIAIFDRSWYGRVLVERVEGLIPASDWRRAYREIVEFERMLVDDGVRLVKIFLHVSAEEQLKRLAERIADPIKHWKIAADDIRNYARRADYIAAIDDMFAATSTKHAPWFAISGEHKWFARVATIETAVKVLGAGLELQPPPVDKEVAKTAKRLLGRKDMAALGLATRRGNRRLSRPARGRA
ncbi:MAG: polyphosphate kinase [Alphaproteobacteria bacterium]|nr:polyphosphate kinase [Alphaproteobacteria bacterium]